jgi:ATP-binding cassette, subfamily F, member 3
VSSGPLKIVSYRFSPQAHLSSRRMCGEMVLLENVSLAFGGRHILRGVSWRIGDRDRVGLVGPNGSGKTTLLRLIKGDLVPDSGSISTSRGTTFGYLPQEELTLSGRTVHDEVMSVFSELARLEEKMRALERRMLDIPEEGPLHDSVMREYAEAQHKFDVKGGFTVDTRVAEVLSGLGFSETDGRRMTEEFSGGWQMRIALAKLLLRGPTVLLLDEPTNHLDLESIIWLEEYLANYPGAVILVSHDRSFLDRVVSRISELGVEGLVDYHGGYSAFVEQREKRREVLIATRRQQEQKIAHLQRFVDRFRADKAKAAMVRSRIKMIERIELVEVPRDHKRIRLQFPQPPRGGAVTVALRNVRQSYGENVVFEGVDLEVSRGDRVAFVGRNGAGKSTLLKIIGGRIPIDHGSVKLGHNVEVQYFDQDPARDLKLGNTVLGELESVSPDEMRPRLRGILGAFLFSGDDVEKRVGVLSGGEKSRLSFAKMLLRPANFLLLDEPTNHLDVASREVLEDALSRYTGTICFVSHDRTFMDALATKVLEVQDGRLKMHIGTYSDYLWRKAQETAGEAASPTQARAGQTAEGPKRGPKSKEQKRQEARERQSRSSAKRASREERRQVQDEISSSEARLEEIEIALADPSIYADGDRVRTIVTEQRELKRRVDQLYERWAELED